MIGIDAIYLRVKRGLLGSPESRGYQYMRLPVRF